MMLQFPGGKGRNTSLFWVTLGNPYIQGWFKFQIYSAFWNRVTGVDLNVILLASALFYFYMGMEDILVSGRNLDL